MSEDKFEIIAISVISIPNGKLQEIYGNKIYHASKNKGEAFRYYYKGCPYFKLLDKSPLRIRLLYLSKEFKNNEEKIIGFKTSEVIGICTE